MSPPWTRRRFLLVVLQTVLGWWALRGLGRIAAPALSAHAGTTATRGTPAGKRGPAARHCLTDWRNSAAWSPADRARACERASVSNEWSENPFGTRPVEVFVAISPGVLRIDGRPTGNADSYNARLGQAVDAAGWSEIAGQRITLWSGSRGQTLTAFDITQEECRAAWAGLVAERYPWAQGLHVDYATSLGWLAPTIPVEFWKTWDAAYVDWARRIRALRGGSKLLFQQYHLTPMTTAADGLFLEEHPQHFGIPLAKQKDMLARFEHGHGKAADCVFEIRHPDDLPEDYVKRCLAFIRENGCFVSWGRDARALVGAPA
jgi:hypothetical protein